ncbi:MAG: hypothetical protein ABF946_09640 [Acetobacter papayae]
MALFSRVPAGHARAMAHGLPYHIVLQQGSNALPEGGNTLLIPIQELTHRNG